MNREELRERLGNIDQIRDIIFGSQLRDYNDRLDKIESSLSLLENDISERLEQIQNACTKQLEAGVESLETKINSVNLNAENENAEIRHSVEHLNKKFSSKIEAIDQTVKQQTTSIRDNLSDTRDRLQEDVRSLKSQVLAELEKQFSTLKDTKVARDDLAEALFELGLRLKGTEFAPELKKAAETDDESEVLLLGASEVSVDH
ncbi:MAG: hypothetical protein WA919_12040 [Coleofasciculaceae cyanobacterium]